MLNGIPEDQIPMLMVERAENQNPQYQIQAFDMLSRNGFVHPKDVDLLNHFRETFGFPAND